MNNNTTNNNIMSVAGTATTEAKPDKVILGVETTNETEKAAWQLIAHISCNQLKQSGACFISAR
jgi:hypothetical protein